MRFLFCWNPKCENHIYVSSSIFFTGKLRLSDGREVTRYEYMLPSFKKLSFCDRCMGAINFFQEAKVAGEKEGADA